MSISTSKLNLKNNPLSINRKWLANTQMGFYNYQIFIFKFKSNHIKKAK